MIENLKRLTVEMDSKSDFVKEVAMYYNLSYIYLAQNWFQRNWAIPEDNLPKIIEMAQAYLYLQNQRQRELLKDTGFDFKNINQ
ncbi:hypothetical protein [Tenacibaculum piscium]|uniref:hypothetical protein n=1 Tax=Tenacibaculum piscium TaxID=1458515 RepID=UPI00187BAB3E|nr:hypothetical protein [Tenacibaculum piscium]MBE7691293.1 hypothetical protein [Tenacibaculum piscium]